MNLEKLRQIASTVGIAGFIFFSWYYATIRQNYLLTVLSIIAMFLFLDYHLQNLVDNQEENNED